MSKTENVSEFDQTKAGAFAGELLTTLNHGALCLMISIGHRTGLFDVMSTLPPSTSEEIAHAAGLNERYVREWAQERGDLYVVSGSVFDRDAQLGRDPDANAQRIPVPFQNSCSARVLDISTPRISRIGDAGLQVGELR